LPQFLAGESGPHQPEIKRGETTPPKPYTENTLLGAMETAGKLVDDEQLREMLKEKGLGTPATRAAIIETLLKRGYVERNKKTLTATDLGRYLIAVVQDPDLKSPELTGQWEGKLRQIEAGRLEADRFLEDIVQYTRRIVSHDPRAPVDETRFGDCPRCGRAVIQGKRGFGCSGWREGCPFVLWPEYQGRPLSVDDIRHLLQRRRLARPWQTEAGERLLVLTDSGAICEIPMPDKSLQRGGGKSGERGKPRRGRGTFSRRPGSKRSEPPGLDQDPARGKAPRRRKSSKTPPPEPREEIPAEADSPDDAAPLGACPLCGAAMIERPKSFSCSSPGGDCRFVIWKSIAGKTITARIARTLIATGQTGTLDGFQSKKGKPFTARLKLVDGQVKFDFNRQ
jgi:DNA topoisomerase-3